MIAQSQLAAIDFNLCRNLSQAETKLGEKRFNVAYSKATNNWSAKPIKEKKDQSVFKNMVSHWYFFWKTSSDLPQSTRWYNMMVVLSQTVM